MVVTKATMPLASLLLLSYLLIVLISGFAVSADREWGLRRSAQSDRSLIGPKVDDDPIYVNGVKFLLFTRENTDEPQHLNISDTTGGSPKYFDATKPVKIAIHGWMSHGAETNKLKNAFLGAMDVNCILVDWASVDSLDYSRAVAGIPLVAERVSLLLDYLIDELGVDPANVHLVGHSLGAHISGVGARNVRSGIVARVTGLDPAGVLIHATQDKSLSKTDASFVDVIHTASNILGIPQSIGHVDFFPNGGTLPQPGCFAQDLRSGTCSHGRSVDYMAESITDRGSFVAFPCQGEGGSPDYSGQSVVMGLDTPPNATGTYCLQTNSRPPFAIPPAGTAERRSSMWPLLRSVNKVGSEADLNEDGQEGLGELVEEFPQAELEYAVLRSFMRQ